MSVTDDEFEANQPLWFAGEFVVNNSANFLEQDADGGNRDVRTVIQLDTGDEDEVRIATASRDGILRIWRWADSHFELCLESEPIFDETIEFGLWRHTCMEQVSRGVVAVGGFSSRIRLYSTETAAVVGELVGHADRMKTGDYMTIAAMTTTERGSEEDEKDVDGRSLLLLLTAGWDETVRIWDGRTRGQVGLLNHEQVGAPTAVSVLSNRTIVTATWKGEVFWWGFDGQQLRRISAHTASEANTCSIRSLVNIPDTGFYTSCNTGGIRVWDYEGDALANFDNAHESHALHVTQWPGDPLGDFLSVGDQSLRVWKHGESVQTCWHPSRPLWCLVVPRLSLVVTACVDGYLRLWSTARGFEAPTASRQLYEQQCRAAREHQRARAEQRVKDDEAASGADFDEEGVTWTFAISDDARPGVVRRLPLRYQYGQNPYHAAATFCDDNGIPRQYEEQIVGEILARLGTNDWQRYRPSLAASSSRRGQEARPKSVHFPAQNPLFFDSSTAALLTKATEFNTALGSPLNEEAVNQLRLLFAALGDQNTVVSIAQLYVVKKMLEWPSEKLYPAIDLIRLMSFHTNGSKAIATDWATHFQPAITAALQSSSNAAQMLAVRTLCNCFKHAQLERTSTPSFEALLAVVVARLDDFGRGSDHLLLSLATLIYNIAALINRQPAISRVHSRIVALLCRVGVHLLTVGVSPAKASSPTLFEVLYRTIVSLGTLTSLPAARSCLSSTALGALAPLEPAMIAMSDARIGQAFQDLLYYITSSPSSSSSASSSSASSSSAASSSASSGLQCEKCAGIFGSQAEAMEHSKQTGHVNFGEVASSQQAGQPRLQCGSCKQLFRSQAEAMSHAKETTHGRFEEVV